MVQNTRSGGAVTCRPHQPVHEVVACGAPSCPRVLVWRPLEKAGRTEVHACWLSGRVANEHGVDYSAEAPDIWNPTRDPPGVRAQLRRRVGVRALLCKRKVRVKDVCQAKVGNQDRGVRQLGTQLDVARPEIAVVHLLRVAVGQRRHHLGGVRRAGLLREPPLPPVYAVQPVAQIAAAVRVRDDEVVGWVFQHVGDAADQRVGE
mmetsp:Transcript_118294/g.314796  ORF Transcript_118294/g.314796 Transcript_118294/m.314796 type:complete len:204 (-) Transcript_118294:214-825(-)